MTSWVERVRSQLVVHSGIGKHPAVMLPALLKDKNEEYNYMTIIAQLLSSSLFLSGPALLLSKISKPYQDNPLPYHRFCCSIICKFNIAIIVSQITGAHNLRKNTMNVGKNNRVKIILPLVITHG